MHTEDDEPPIKSHPASKEYRANYDTIDWGPPDERSAGGNVTIDEQLDAFRLDTASTVLENLKKLVGGVDTIVDGEFYLNPEAAKLGVRDETERRAQPRPVECSTCGAKDAAPCDDDIHETTGKPIER